MQEINVSWGGSRKIEYIPVEGKICAYRSTLFMDGIEKGVDEGIAHLDKIKKIVKDEPIPAYTVLIKRRSGHRSERVFLCRDTIFDAWRNTRYGEDDYHKIYETDVLQKPYSYLRQNSIDGTRLLVPAHYDGNLFDLESKVYPRQFYFSYMNGNVDNKKYDLDKSLEILKKRTDITWMPGEGYSRRRGEPGKPEVHSIPHYNQDEGRTSCLYFLWTPSDEDWAKVLPYAASDRMMFEWKIVELIFQLPERAKERAKNCLACKSGDEEYSDAHHYKCELFKEVEED